jgi:hypothetical protein
MREVRNETRAHYALVLLALAAMLIGALATSTAAAPPPVDALISLVP